MTLLTILSVFPSLMLLVKVLVVNFLRPPLLPLPLAGKLANVFLLLDALFVLLLRMLEFLTNIEKFRILLMGIF